MSSIHIFQYAREIIYLFKQENCQNILTFVLGLKFFAQAKCPRFLNHFNAFITQVMNSMDDINN